MIKYKLNDVNDHLLAFSRVIANEHKANNRQYSLYVSLEMIHNNSLVVNNQHKEKFEMLKYELNDVNDHLRAFSRVIANEHTANNRQAVRHMTAMTCFNVEQ